MKTLPLFDVPKTAQTAREKLTAFKALHGILTYRTPGMLREDHPWLALKPFDDDKCKTLGEIVATRCRLYEESGHCQLATGELSAVRLLCKHLKIECPF